MEREKSQLMVLARIPNLSSGGSEGAGHATLPNEDGRMISQTVAFRLLAATILLLLVVAIIPFSMSNKTPKPAPTAAASTPSPSPAADTVGWMPHVASAPQQAAETAPQMSSWSPPIRPTSSQIEESREGLPPAGNRPMAAEAAPQMSSWPSLNRPMPSQIEEPREGLPSAGKQPMETRWPQYKADARTGY